MGIIKNQIPTQHLSKVQTQFHTVILKLYLMESIVYRTLYYGQALSITLQLHAWQVSQMLYTCSKFGLRFYVISNQAPTLQ
jgi:hypothetical protein